MIIRIDLGRGNYADYREKIMLLAEMHDNGIASY